MAQSVRYFLRGTRTYLWSPTPTEKSWVPWVAIIPVFSSQTVPKSESTRSSETLSQRIVQTAFEKQQSSLTSGQHMFKGRHDCQHLSSQPVSCSKTLCTQRLQKLPWKDIWMCARTHAHTHTHTLAYTYACKPIETHAHFYTYVSQVEFFMCCFNWTLTAMK